MLSIYTSFKNNYNYCWKPRDIKLLLINATKQISGIRYLTLKNKVSVTHHNWAMTSLLYLKEFAQIKRPHVTRPPLLLHLQ